MYDGVKGQFVKALGDGVNPKTIPAHFVVYYDNAVLMYTKFGHFSGVEDVPANDWPLICLMAELKFKGDQLEARVAELENAEPDSTFHKIDLRTKEGRVLRTQKQMEPVGA